MSQLLLLLLQASQSNINLNELSLAMPIPDKVPASYRQNIHINGHKVLIQTSTYHTNSGISMFHFKVDQPCMLVPVDDWLRSQLSVIQNFVVSHVSIPADVPQTKEGTYSFKSLVEQTSLLISLSKWCRIFKFDASKGTYERVENFTQFGKGTFSATLEISHVYIGPHKNGNNFSLSLRVKELVYNEEKQEDDNILLNELLAAEVEVEKKAKSSKKPRKTAECRRSTKSAVSLGAK